MMKVATESWIQRNLWGLNIFLSAWVALLLLRHQMILGLQLEPLELWHGYLYLGWLQDAMVCLFPLVGAYSCKVLFGRPFKGIWGLLLLGVWFTAVNNSVYFQFFGDLLYLWIIKLNIKETSKLAGIGFTLFTPLMIFSSISMLASVIQLSFLQKLNIFGELSQQVRYKLHIIAKVQVSCWLTLILLMLCHYNPLIICIWIVLGYFGSIIYLWSVERKSSFKSIFKTFKYQRSHSVANMLLLWSMLPLLYHLPVWVAGEQFHQSGISVSQQILRVWWDEWNGKLLSIQVPQVAKTTGNKATVSDEALEELSSQEYAQKLLDFKDYPNVASKGTPRPFQYPRNSYQTLDPQYPLETHMETSPETTRALRHYFGFEQHVPLHVVIVYIEGWRYYELQHDKYAKIALPKLRQLLSKHGLLFTKTYSSGLTAGGGQTARGMFATMCSMLPNVRSIPVVLEESGFPVHCMGDLFQHHGYTTMFSYGMNKGFHNTGLFMETHGIEHVYDQEYFDQQGLKDLGHGMWGHDDAERIEASRTLFEKAASTAPIFGAYLSINTHPPHILVPGWEIPQEVIEPIGASAQYEAFLSQLKHTDAAVFSFVQKLFEGPIGDKTLVVVMGDHSLPVLPPESLTREQVLEMKSRVPFAFLSKNITQPTELHYPVHQIDLAPSIAQVLGLSGKVSWLGRSVFTGEGSPWVFWSQKHLHYRTASRGCYHLGMHMRCWEFPSTDDLLGNKPLQRTTEKERDHQLFSAALSSIWHLVKQRNFIKSE